MKPKIRQTFRFCSPGLLFLTLLVICLSAARAWRPPFKIYTTGEGLAHDNVNRIIHDSRGFFWFCTA